MFLKETHVVLKNCIAEVILLEILAMLMYVWKEKNVNYMTSNSLIIYT